MINELAAKEPRINVCVANKKKGPEIVQLISDNESTVYLISKQIFYNIYFKRKS